MSLPEGLTIISDPDVPGNLLIVDAQDITWLILTPGAIGDPIEWRQSILERVMNALDIQEDA